MGHFPLNLWLYFKGLGCFPYQSAHIEGIVVTINYHHRRCHWILVSAANLWPPLSTPFIHHPSDSMNPLLTTTWFYDRHSEKNGTKTVPQGYYLIVRKTVPLGVLFWYHIAKRVLFSTQFLPKNRASTIFSVNMIIKETRVPLCKSGAVFQGSTQRVLF